MLSLEVFHKIHECRDFGLSMNKTAKKLGIAPLTVRKWWNATESDFLDVTNTRFRYLDNYKEFMLEQLRICPQIKVTNLFYKVREGFPDFNCPRSAFYRYDRKLRADYGFDKFSGRQTSPRAPLPSGYEAQVDFGQSKMIDMYGRIARVYFFCMVLSYSRMHFVYFNSKPFTTNAAIRAHEYAFRYFGGRTHDYV